MNAQNKVGIPTQRPLPLLGHILQFQRRPLEFFTEIYRQPEPIVRIKMGRQDAYVLTTPELIMRVQRGKESHSVEKGPLYDAARIALGDGLLSSSEPKHIRHRRLMQPAFHRDNITSYIQIMQEETTRMIDSWQEGEVVHFDHAMREISIRVVARALFGSDIGARVVEETHRSFPIIAATIPKLAFFPWLAKVPIINKEFNIAKKRLSAVIKRIIAEYRASGKDYGDLVSMLMAARFEDDETKGLTDEDLHNEILAVYSASMETTAAVASFVYRELCRRDDIREKLEQEVSEVLQGGPVTSDNIRQLVYTERVVAEALRRYTPTWLNTRRTMNDIELDGVTIPAKTPLLFSFYAMHNDPKNFPEPDNFDPDRWTMDYRKEVTRAGVYQPFATGKHTCIGEAFAWFEIMTIVATVAQRTSLKPFGQLPEREKTGVALESQDLPLTVHFRDSVLGCEKLTDLT